MWPKEWEFVVELFIFVLYFILFFGHYEFYFIPEFLIVPQMYLFSEMAKCKIIIKVMVIKKGIEH